MGTEGSNKTQLDDYFTATIVGLPDELTLGKAFTSRQFRNEERVTVDAITAQAWLSEPARLALKQQLQSRRQVNMGMPFPAGKFARSRKLRQSSIYSFLLGFIACMLLLLAYSLQTWVRLPFFQL